MRKLYELGVVIDILYMKPRTYSIRELIDKLALFK